MKRMKITKIGSTTLTIIKLDENTPEYEGASDILKVETPDLTICFRTEDAEGYYSDLNKIDIEEFERLKKYERK